MPSQKLRDHLVVSGSLSVTVAVVIVTVTLKQLDVLGVLLGALGKSSSDAIAQEHIHHTIIHKATLSEQRKFSCHYDHHHLHKSDKEGPGLISLGLSCSEVPESHVLPSIGVLVVGSSTSNTAELEISGKR